MSQETNPYESPQVVDAPIHGIDEPPRLLTKWRSIDWTFVFVLNLILPVLLGWQITNSSAKFGAAIVTSVFYAIGLWACVRLPRYFVAIAKGGLFIAVFQFVPILHIVFGSIAMGVAELMGHVTPDPFDLQNDTTGTVNSITGGMIVTLLTGTPLIFIAVAVGLWGTRRRKVGENQ